MANDRQTGLPANWAELSPAQKREHRLNQFLNPPDIPFVSPEEAIADAIAGSAQYPIPYLVHCIG